MYFSFFYKKFSVFIERILEDKRNGWCNIFSRKIIGPFKIVDSDKINVQYRALCLISRVFANGPGWLVGWLGFMAYQPLQVI